VRRRRGKQALLQHGSILLQKSNFAPGVAWIGGTLRSGPELRGFRPSLSEATVTGIEFVLQTVTLLEPLRRRAEEIESATFAATTWNRNP
jgi:hypothetical protein